MNDIEDLLGEIAHEFHLSQEELDGRHERRCKLTGAVCSICKGPEAVMRCEHVEVKTFGLNMTRLLWYRARLLAIYELRLKWIILEQTGEWPDKGFSEDRRGRAEAPPSDPFALFPDDVDYFSEHQCREQQVYWAKKLAIWKSKGNADQITDCERRQWPEERVQACIGKDQPARRCSMNDSLWGKWCDSYGTLTLEDVKKLLKRDLIRHVLYRPGDDPESDPDPAYVQTLPRDLVDRVTRELEELDATI